MLQVSKTSVSLITLLLVCCTPAEKDDDTMGSYELTCIVNGLQFAEGPAHQSGLLYFSDITANKIHTWRAETGLSLFRSNSGNANGLCFGGDGRLYVCEGGNKLIASIGDSQDRKILTSSYQGKPYNEPNDLWVAPSGNVYFTDPVFTGTLTQDGQHVYCVKASTGEVVRVADDLVKPNGITGSPDGSVIYIADWGASRIYRYSVLPDGSLSSKVLFASLQADGLKTDEDGNLYAAGTELMVYDRNGRLIISIPVPGTITNVCLANDGTKLLFVTTHNSVYQLKFSL